MRRVVVWALILVLASGCADTRIGAREKGALAGGALGAGLGAIVGNQFGSPGAGVAIGSAFGALSGGLVGDSIDSQDAALQDRQERIERQELEIAENQRIIDELRKLGADADQSDRGVTVNLPDVLFQFGSASLTQSAQRTVGKIARVIASSGRRVAIEGHTDSVGGREFNQRLSRERARSVAEELAVSGVERSLMSVRGYGMTRPIASNATAEGKMRNRRVEVIIQK